MKITLDIKSNRFPFFMELVKSLKYVQVVEEKKNEHKTQFIRDFIEALDNVKQYEKGKKKLKSAKDLLNEL
jgi:hypothetical protein